MTNISRIIYNTDVAKGAKYVQIDRFMSVNPYLADSNEAYGKFADGRSSLVGGDVLLLEPETGKLYMRDYNKPDEQKNNVDEVPYLTPPSSYDFDGVKELVGQSTIKSVKPGEIVIESPDEVFWFSYPYLNAPVIDQEYVRNFYNTTEDFDKEVEDAVKTEVTLVGNPSNPSIVSYNNSVHINGELLDDLLNAKIEKHKKLAEAETSSPKPEVNPAPAESGTIRNEPPAATEERADETDNSGDNMAKYDELAAAKGKLIRKALGGFIMVAPMDVKVPEKVFADKQGNFIDFKKAGFTPLGWLTKGDGINFSRETEQAEVESFGAQEPTRVDFTKDTTSAAFNCQETNKKVLELYYSQDLSDVKPDSETGEISFEQRDPETIYRRMIYIAHDGKGKDAKYIVKIMPKATISEVQEQAWSSESELAYGMTAKASKDDDLGYSVRHVFGGPGFEKLYADMGFTKAASGSGSTTGGNTASQ